MINNKNNSIKLNNIHAIVSDDYNRNRDLINQAIIQKWFIKFSKSRRTLSEISKANMRDPEYRENLIELLVRNGISKETEKKLKEYEKRRQKRSK